MVALILSLLGALRSALRTHVDLAIENLALRQQLANLRRTSSRPRLRNSDRAFWLVLSRLWSRWADVLVVVKPDTVVRWHRTGFRLFWRWKSHSGSPSDGGVSQETRRLIRQMAEANVGWGAPRIHGELLKLGIDISERSVSRFMPPSRGSRPPKPGAPSSTITSARWHRSISSRYPPRRFGFCMSSLSWLTTDVAFFTSASPSAPALPGPPSKSSRRSPKTPRPSTCSAIAPASSATSSAVGSTVSVSTKSSPHRDRLGRIRMLNASWDPYGGSVSTTSSSSVSAISIGS